jgi:hypothetical protein
MRKYWKTTTIIVLIVFTIGTFYVNAATSAEHYPEFAIQTLSGNPDEVKSLEVKGSYLDSSSMANLSSNVKINTEGSLYTNHTFLSTIIGNPPAVIKDYVKEHRSFMRGKNTWVDLFFENDQFLVYADVEDKSRSFGTKEYMFDLSLLNKEDGTNTSFQVNVPAANELEYMNVLDVQMVKNEVYLITRNMVRQTNNSNLHIYTIDIENQEISSQEALVQVPKGADNTYTHVGLIETNSTKAKDFLILFVTEEKIVEDTESTRVEESSQEILSYHLATKKIERIQVPNLSLDENQISFFDGSSLYFTRLSGKEFVVTPYNLTNKQAGKAFSFELSNQKEVQAPMITVKDGKLYAVTTQMNTHINSDVIVADVTTGETLFKGQITLKDSPEQKGPFELYVYDIFLN